MASPFPPFAWFAPSPSITITTITLLRGSSGTASFQAQAGLVRIHIPPRAMHLPLSLKLAAAQPAVPILIVTPSTPSQAEEKPLLSPRASPEKEDARVVDEEDLYEAPAPSSRRRLILLVLSIISLLLLTALLTCHPSLSSIHTHTKRSSKAAFKVRVRLNIGMRQHARDFAVEQPLAQAQALAQPSSEQLLSAEFASWLAGAFHHEHQASK